MMHFLLWSRVAAHEIRARLGTPEYSYFFVLKEFLPAFERLGPTRVIDDIAEADALFDECRGRGDDCLLVVFAAPHNTPPPGRCPLVPMIAWEFDRIPDEEWDGEPRHDWRRLLAHCARVLTLSRFAARAFRAAMGEDFPVCALPVPIWERMESARRIVAAATRAPVRLLVEGAVLDAHAYEVSTTRLRPRDPWRSLEAGVWSGEDIELDFRTHAPGVGALGGFYMPERWGSWSRNEEVWVLLPCFVRGPIVVELDARAFGPNVGRTLLVGCGDQYRTLCPGDALQTFTLDFDLASAARMLHIRGIDITPPENTPDPRTIGVGLGRLRLRRRLASLLAVDFRDGGGSERLAQGFNLPEPWGTWSREALPELHFPEPLSGAVRVRLTGHAFGANAFRELHLELGSAVCAFGLPHQAATRELDLDLQEPASSLRIAGAVPEPESAAHEPRQLGVGLSRVEIFRREAPRHFAVSLRADESSGALLQGFNASETWGAWSCAAVPAVVLPWPVFGRVRLRILGLAYGANASRPLELYLGSAAREFAFGHDIGWQEFEFDLSEPAQVLCISGALPQADTSGPGARLLGIGIERIEVLATEALPPDMPVTVPARVRHELLLDGVVYTSVLNPRDHRKNWEKMIATFCAAFADTGDATLVLKMTHRSQASYLFELHYLLQRLPPFDCRVVLVHGFLDDDDYARLIARTDYYFNLSTSEGLCIPAMEFMACGRPVVAPHHTSLLDFLDTDNSFPIAAGVEPCVWPHDEREVLRTRQYRIEQDSAIDVLRRSHRLRLGDPAAYARMSESAQARMRGYCGLDAVAARLGAFLQAPVADAGAGSGP